MTLAAHLPHLGREQHNGGVNNGQSLTPCPQCGTSTAVHSISELADMARTQLSQMSQLSGTPNPGVPQQGWNAEPVAGPPPGPGGRRSFGNLGGGFGRRGRDYGMDVGDSIEDAIAGAAMGAAAGLIGRAIKKRVEQTMANRVMPAVNAAAASREPMLREQIAVAEKYPEICACITDQVVFLAGGSQVVPMPNLQTLTLAQADGLVAQLRGG
jgi:hypothetical protein